MIELKDLTKKFGDFTAVDNLNLSIETGEFFGLLGPNGAGKSTLVRCINLLEKPTAGQVIIDGEDITVISRKRLLDLRRSIGMIFQDFNLLEQRSVLRNVTFPLEVAGVKHDIAKETFCFRAAESQFAQFYLIIDKILRCDDAADLMFV